MGWTDELTVENFFLNPWEFWMWMMGGTRFTALMTLICVFLPLILFFFFLPFNYALGATAILFLWMGPGCFLSPITLLFILPSVVSGEDWDLRVGCGRNIYGKVECM